MGPTPRKATNPASPVSGVLPNTPPMMKRNMSGIARVNITVIGSRAKSLSSSQVILSRRRTSLALVQFTGRVAGQFQKAVLQGGLLHQQVGRDKALLHQSRGHQSQHGAGSPHLHPAPALFHRIDVRDLSQPGEGNVAFSSPRSETHAYFLGVSRDKTLRAIQRDDPPRFHDG